MSSLWRQWIYQRLGRYALGCQLSHSTWIIKPIVKEEYFEIIRAEDGSVEVFMYNKTSSSPPTKGKNFYYYRKFLPKETKEIRVFGLAGDDVFVVKGESKRSILVRIVGGPGNETIIDSSMARGLGKKTWVYERDPGSVLELGKEGRQVFNVQDFAFNYDRKAYTYDRAYPLPYIWPMDHVPVGHEQSESIHEPGRYNS